MANNNSNEQQNHMPEPTMWDLFNLITKNASKDDIADVKNQIQIYKAETDEKIEILSDKVDAVVAESAQNTDRIDWLEANIEILKQDQLKNNVCISGVPPDQVKNTDTAEIITKIASKLDINLPRSHFTSYAVANNKFIIVHFHNLKNKQTMLNKIRVKRSLMVEEVFQQKSNSQIYLNDHLTPYFNKLYLMARDAKKQGKLSSASSYGGKIRARKNPNDVPIVITSEKQLNALISSQVIDDSNGSFQHVSFMNSSHSTDTNTNTVPPHRTRNTRSQLTKGKKPSTSTRAASNSKTDNKSNNNTKQNHKDKTNTHSDEGSKNNSRKRRADIDSSPNTSRDNTAKKTKDNATYTQRKQSETPASSAQASCSSTTQSQ